MKRAIVALLIVIGSVSIWYRLESRRYGPPQLPLYAMEVSIYRGAERKFHETMREFAAEHGFRIRIKPLTPDERTFSITLRRSDIWMNLSSDSNSAWDYNGAFYRTYKPEPSRELILKLAEDLGTRAEEKGAFFRFYDPSEDEDQAKALLGPAQLQHGSNKEGRPLYSGERPFS